MSVPQSIFRFGNTPLTKPASGVVYTRTFAGSSDQLTWMQSKLTLVKEGNYEVRPYSGKYRGNWCADDIISCNYCMFTNGERWWYAFIDRIVYVNEQVCEFEFTIDDLQTWYFDYSLTPVFVEREHAATDVIGDNLLDEPVSTGELKYQAQDILSAMSVQSYIVECNEEPSVDTAGGAGKVPCKTGRVNGMYSGCGKFYFDADNLAGLNTFLESMNKAGCGSSIVSIYGIPKTLVAGKFNNSQNMFEIAHSLNRQYGPEQWCIYRGKHLMNFVDNHDVTRIASILTNKKHLPLTYGLLFGMPGIPCIYYGSEWGEEGVKAPDNDYALRPCFEEPKPNELTALITKLIDIRRTSDALCNGIYRNVVITNHQLIFERKTDSEKILVAINASDSEFTAGNGELQGNYIDLIKEHENVADAAPGAAVNDETDKAGTADAAPETAAPGSQITLNGQLVLPPYSVQYLKSI